MECIDAVVVGFVGCPDLCVIQEYAFDESLEVMYLHLYTESPAVVDVLEIPQGVQY